MPFVTRKRAWMLLATGSAVLAGLAVRRLLESAWEEVQGEPPPLNPAHPDTDWGPALAWTAAAGAAIGVSRLLARRGVAAAWGRALHEAPPFGD